MDLFVIAIIIIVMNICQDLHYNVSLSLCKIINLIVDDIYIFFYHLVMTIVIIAILSMLLVRIFLFFLLCCSFSVVAVNILQPCIVKATRTRNW